MYFYICIMPQKRSCDGSQISAFFCCDPAIKENSDYIVAGKQSISLNITHPSVVEDKQMEYRLILTANKLPGLEEVLVSGPTSSDIEVQVQNDVKHAHF